MIKEIFKKIFHMHYITNTGKEYNDEGVGRCVCGKIYYGAIGKNPIKIEWKWKEFDKKKSKTIKKELGL